MTPDLLQGLVTDLLEKVTHWKFLMTACTDPYRRFIHRFSSDMPEVKRPKHEKEPSQRIRRAFP